MRTFVLDRQEDETGVSGTGYIAEGVMFENGKCVLSWRTPCTSIGVYSSISDVVSIHGHDGKTKVVWT